MRKRQGPRPDYIKLAHSQTAEERDKAQTSEPGDWQQIKEYAKKHPRRSAGLVLSIIALSIAAIVKQGEPYHTTEREQQAGALLAVDKVLNQRVVVKPGVMMRLTPDILDGDPNEPFPNNQAGPTDKKLIIERPLQDAELPGWIAFTRPDVDAGDIEDFKSIDDRAEDTVWVHQSQLESDRDAYSQPIAPGIIEDEPVELTTQGQIAIKPNVWSGEKLPVVDPTVALSHYE